MATEAQILANRRNAQKSTGPEPVSSSPPSPKLPILPSFPRNYDLIMQNKPNFPDDQMNVNKVLTRDYENKSNWKLDENKANTKPIKAKTNPIKPNL